MANCHKFFLYFHSNIVLKPNQKNSLKKSREAVREKIRDYFRDKHNGFSPNFHGQGSFMMKTIIEPLDGEFDIDDGIYFKVEAEPSQSIGKIHSWICEAVDGHTNKNPIDKPTCVRLVYAKKYHLDLPIYYIIEGQTPYLAHKEKGWIKSDPREFRKWFDSKADEEGQLKRIVCYLKAWSDYQGKLLSGLIFSILAANNIVFVDKRDDVALYKTLCNIRNVLEKNFVCDRPTTPAGENLLEDYSEGKKNNFFIRLNSLIQSAEKAVDEKTNQRDACEAWQRYFGDRFSCSKSEEETKVVDYADTEEFIESYFSVDIQYHLNIDCLVSQNDLASKKGFATQILSKMLSHGWRLFPGKNLEFNIVDCDVPEPFQVKWKVRNVGEEARRRNQIRGQIEDDCGNHQKSESSDFHGSHFVECYIIKDNVCVARSRIDVPIKKQRL